VRSETTKKGGPLATAGIVLFGICSCIYDYFFAVSKSVM
jgi:hypothetical protein